MALVPVRGQVHIGQSLSRVVAVLLVLRTVYTLQLLVGAVKRAVEFLIELMLARVVVLVVFANFRLQGHVLLLMLLQVYLLVWVKDQLVFCTGNWRFGPGLRSVFGKGIICIMVSVCL